jgi:hypothetical protein
LVAFSDRSWISLFIRRGWITGIFVKLALFFRELECPSQGLDRFRDELDLAADDCARKGTFNVLTALDDFHFHDAVSLPSGVEENVYANIL